MSDYLKKLIKKHKKTDEISERSIRQAPSLVLKKIYPKKIYYFGKIIVFCIDSDSIQMACSLHLGQKVKILDVNKVYFPKKNFNDIKKEILISGTISDYIDQYKKGGVKVFPVMQYIISLQLEVILKLLATKLLPAYQALKILNRKA